MRLQVFLSKSGISSRRTAVNIIKSGKIRVNDKIVLEPSFKVNPEIDKVFLNNKIITPREKVYIMLHKPKGVTTTKKDPFATQTVMDLIPHKFNHLNPVGRLDKDTTGLLLLTNDGTLLHKLTHPRFNVKKMYSVTTDKGLLPKDKIKLEKGIYLEGKNTLPCKIRLISVDNLEITIREGRKRQIKKMFRKLGYRVMSLKRLKEGPLTLGTLPEGKWIFLTEKERCELTQIKATFS